MKTITLLVPVASVIAATSASAAVVVAGWTFETSAPDINDSSTIGPIASEVGTGSASGVHASAATDWSSPAGNGSAKSFNSNNWGIGDYYQFQVNTSALTEGHIQIAWQQTRSSTGPASWKLAYSTDGSTFTDAMTYSVSQVTWSSTIFNSGSSQSWGASSVLGGLLGKSTLIFQLIADSSPGGTTGTSRVDDVYITVVPEPHEYAALGALGLLGFAAWRRTRRA